MTATRATLADLFLAGAPATREGIEVAGYVVVVEYHAATRTADVRSAVQIDNGPGPIVYGVPVQHPQGGGRSITWGLEPGDVLLGVVRSRSHDEIDDGAEVPLTPASSRRFDWSDQVVIPSGRGALPYREDGQMVIGLPAAEALYVGADDAAEYLTRNDLVRTNLNAIKTALDTIAAAAGVANSYAVSATRSDRIRVDG